MKTPLQELLEWESDLSQMFDSDQRIAIAVLERIRSTRKEMLDKEKEILRDTMLIGFEYSGEDYNGEYPFDYDTEKIRKEAQKYWSQFKDIK